MKFVLSYVDLPKQIAVMDLGACLVTCGHR